MKKTNIIIIVLVLVVIGISLFSFTNKSSVKQVDTPQVPSTTLPVSNISPTSTNSNVKVSIKSFSFNPTTLNIKKGTKITWTNNDKVSHTITPDSGNRLNSGALSPGKSFSFTPTDLGSINYHCAFHPKMKGSIIVHK